MIKQIELADTDKPMVVLNYAEEHNFKVIHIEKQSPVKFTLAECKKEFLQLLENSGCVEWCFHKEQEQYCVYSDIIMYRIIIYGFQSA